VDIEQVQRLIAVTRWLQRYASVVGDHLEPYFLASTEAENVLFAENMAAFRLPSRMAASSAGIDQTRYTALAKQWVWHSLGLLQPDLLIVDTWPRGAFGELLNAFDLCRKRVFIYSPDSQAIAEAPDFQAMLPLYDLILVPEYEGVCALPFGSVDPDRVRWIGPVMTREKVELLDRWEAREQVGAHPDSFVLYVSVGSGADIEARECLHSICAAVVDEPDVHLVVGGGPLFFGSMLQGPQITWLNGPSADLMLGFDAAISSAGYSAYHELVAAGVPTAWIPRSRLGDDQLARAARAQNGLEAILLEAGDLRGSKVRAVLDRLRERRAVRPSLETEPAEYANFARVAAQAVLSTIWDMADVETASLAVGDAVLRAAADMSLPPHALITFARWVSREAKPGEKATRATCTLFDALFAHALHPPLGFDLVKPLCEVLPMGNADERVDAVIALLDQMACFEDWGAAITFVQHLIPEKEVSLTAFRNTIEALLRAGGDHGLSLQDITDCLDATSTQNGQWPQQKAITQLIERLVETTALKAGAI
jgi:predicted glycosyltransferase